MRVLIMSDMEGVSGIVVWDQVTGGKPMYEECRKLYTEEINAAVRGARAGGATEIVVVDCHGAGGDWTCNSLVPELLDPGCEFVVQKEWTEYTGILEDGCDAALFVAMHAMAGTPDGVLSHTRVIVLTARAGEREVLEALELGAYDHVAKPFSVPVLMQRVRRAMTR